jgi:hypothetical protein
MSVCKHLVVKLIVSLVLLYGHHRDICEYVPIYV